MSQPANPDFENMVRNSFARQGAMSLIKAELTSVTHGTAEITVPHWEGLEQQHGYIHGGVVGMVADSAAGYAAMSIIPRNANVLSVEYKLNFAAPAQGEQLVARGRVLRPGRTLIVSAADVYSIEDGREVLCAIMQQTIIVLYDKK
ncbi:MAG TPA: PaaI family thioesterase [Burkholderiaceae bacterium]|nr:PaaI family thioesterase [Burkholderiaceae bacterium]